MKMMIFTSLLLSTVSALAGGNSGGGSGFSNPQSIEHIVVALSSESVEGSSTQALNCSGEKALEGGNEETQNLAKLITAQGYDVHLHKVISRGGSDDGKVFLIVDVPQ